MPESMKPYSTFCLLFLGILYFSIQALTGDRGLLNGSDRTARLERAEQRLASLDVERKDLEVRARYLRTDNLSRDLLEERARVVLGYSDPRDYVIRTLTPAQRAAAGHSAARRS